MNSIVEQIAIVHDYVFHEYREYVNEDDNSDVHHWSIILMIELEDLNLDQHETMLLILE